MTCRFGQLIKYLPSSLKKMNGIRIRKTSNPTNTQKHINVVFTTIYKKENGIYILYNKIFKFSNKTYDNYSISYLPILQFINPCEKNLV